MKLTLEDTEVIATLGIDGFGVELVRIGKCFNGVVTTCLYSQVPVHDLLITSSNQ